MSQKSYQNPYHDFEAPVLESESTVDEGATLTSPFTSVFRRVGESPVLAHSNTLAPFAINHTLESMRDLLDGKYMSMMLNQEAFALAQGRQYGDDHTEIMTNERDNAPKFNPSSKLSPAKKCSTETEEGTFGEVLPLTEAESSEEMIMFVNVMDDSTAQPSSTTLSQSLQTEEGATGKVSPVDTKESSEQQQKNRKVQRKKIQKSPEERGQSARKDKNTAKNFGKAMASFSLSSVGAPYLKKCLEKYQLSLKEFKNFIHNKKESINGVSTLQPLLYAEAYPRDSNEYKQRAVFQEVGEIFMRDFAVNWIFQSKSNSKDALLAYRFKMLRRIQNPSKFNYLL